MAYEQLDREALTKMVEQYDKDNAPKEMPKVGFWTGLLASFGSIESSTVTQGKQIAQHNYRCNNYLAGGESEMTVHYDKRNGSNYSPMVGGNDWDW